jgi:hypothetical protein
MPHAPRIGEITTRNSRQHLRSLHVKLRPRGQGVIIYGHTAARDQSTEFTGYLMLDTRKAIRDLCEALLSIDWAVDVKR